MHKSVVASLVLAGAEPVWLRPRWDEERQIAHPATARDEAVVDYLRAGVASGMVLPDASDPKLKTFRVVAD